MRLAFAIVLAILAAGCGRRNFNDQRDAAGDADATDVDAPSPLCATTNCVFVTNNLYRSDVGVAGADASCNAEAAAAGLPGTYRAFLSTSSEPAASRFLGSRGWVRPDGEIVVTGGITALYSQGALVPIALTADGVDLRGTVRSVWTGTSRSGAFAATCSDWTVADSSSATIGNLQACVGFSDFMVPAMCSESHRLFCFGVGNDTPQVIPAPAGPIAFVSIGTLAGNAGIAAADAICATEGAILGPRTFRALLGTVGVTAASRFSNPLREYFRPDGVRLGRLLVGEEPRTSIAVTASGTYSNRVQWTGGAPTSVVSASTSCTGWESATGTGTIGFSYEATSSGTFAGSVNSCTQSLSVLCLED